MNIEPKIGSHAITWRELNVLQCAARGKSYRGTALELGISPETVKGAMRNIRWKLNAHTRTHAVAIAIRAGLL